MTDTQQKTLACSSLRWKEMLLDLDLEPDPADKPCWCVRTQTCLGPDGQVADKEGCNPTRSCYET
jgi:hypothetical protein